MHHFKVSVLKHSAMQLLIWPLIIQTS